MVDAALICAFCEVESGFNARAFLMDRNGGSYGLTQLDLPTAQDRGYAGAGPGLYDPATNILYFLKHIAWITDSLTARGLYNFSRLAAAYNAGLAHVLTGGTDDAYTVKILAAYAKWRIVLGD